jgi:hypothetical protein
MPESADGTLDLGDDDSDNPDDWQEFCDDE